MNNFKKLLSNNLYIVILFLLGLFLRGYCLSSKSLWYDEIFVLSESKRAFVALFNVDSEGIHPPLYRLVMHLWMYFGQNEKLVRIPSLIFSLAGIILGYKTAKLIFNKRAALFTAFFISTSPFHVYYAQEVKGYSLFFLLSLLSVYFFLKSVKKNKIILWSGYVFFTALSVYTHYFGFLNIFAQNLFMIFSHRKHAKGLFRRWITAQCLIFLLFIPWLSACIQHLARVTDNFWIPSVSLENIFIIFKNFTLGYYTSNLNFLFLQFSLFIIFLCGIWSLIFLKKSEKEENPVRIPSEGLPILLSYLLIPIPVLIYSKIIRPIYLDRTLIVISFFYYMILSKGIEAVRKNRAVFFPAIFSLVILIAVSLENYYRGDNFSPSIGIVSKEKQYRETIKYIGLNYREGDIVLLSHYSSWPSLEYYSPENVKNRLYLITSFSSENKGDKYSEIGLRQRFNFKTMDIRELEKKENTGIWLVCSHWTDTPFISPELQEWMNMHAGDLIFKSDAFRGMELYYFK